MDLLTVFDVFSGGRGSVSPVFPHPETVGGNSTKRLFQDFELIPGIGVFEKIIPND
jgi:hypothetical protein